jgi:hypothetical protein
MAISYVGSNTATAPNQSSITIPMPAGLQENDVVIVCADTGGGNQDRNIVVTGWTGIADLYANDSIDVNFGVAYKVMGATPDTDVTVSITAGTGQWSGITLAFRGVDTTTPLDATSTTATGTNSLDANPPSITTVTNGCEIIVVAGVSDGAIGTYTYPSGYSDGIDVPGSSSNNRSLAAHKSQATAGAEDPGVFSNSSSSVDDCWAAVTIALRPAASGEFALAMDAGSYTVTGVAANLLASRLFSASAGSYAITGVAADLLVSRLFSAAAGNYSLTGAPLTFAYSAQEETVVSTPNLFFGIGPMGKTRVHPHPLFCRVKQ